jgi:hypothetical protein
MRLFHNQFVPKPTTIDALTTRSKLWNVNPQGQPARVAATEAGDRQLGLRTNPIWFIEAGLAARRSALMKHARHRAARLTANWSTCVAPIGRGQNS